MNAGVVIAAVGLACAGAAWTQVGGTTASPATVPPTTRVQDCTTSGCHGPIIDHRVMHGPAAIAACTACHEYADPAAHAFVMKRQGSALCTFCHVGADSHLGLVAHKPFVEGDCTGCHDPHGSHDKMLLKAESQSALCARCHDGVIRGSHVHTPAMDGNCLSCHGAHGAEHKGLLNRAGRDMCLTCHQDTQDRMRAAAHPHEPAQGDCLQCHDAHGSDFEAHLLKAPRALCASCHEPQVMLATHAPFKHSAVLEGRSCLNCHQAHASDHDGLLHDNPIASCMSCHSEPIVLEGRTIAAVSEIMAEGAFRHGPVRKDLCTGCHELHGSSHAMLLSANYTGNFYEPFSVDHYALCFRCHAQELVLNERTGTETNFRNGEQNLHFVHVNRDRLGRSCRSCHATHASQSPLHVVDSVKFGQWELPLGFTQTESGGSCNSGCHRPATYDRLMATEGIQMPDRLRDQAGGAGAARP